MATWRTATYGPAAVLDHNSNPIPAAWTTILDGVTGYPAQLPSGSCFVQADRSGNLTFGGASGQYQIVWQPPAGAAMSQLVTITAAP